MSIIVASVVLSNCASLPTISNDIFPTTRPAGHIFNDPRLVLTTEQRTNLDEIAILGGSGDFKAQMTTDASLSTHTLYYPREIENLSIRKLPIIAWANGACLNMGNRFRYYLTDIASYGYFIAAIGPIKDDTQEQRPRPTPTNPVQGQILTNDGRILPPPETDYKLLIDAIDWAIAQNANPNSKFYNHLDTEKIAIMGQSCGGLQTIAASYDPRVSTSVILNSGIRQGEDPIAGTGFANKQSLLHLHAPTLYLSGDENDVAFYNANSDFVDINHIPVARAYKHGIGHGGTYNQANGGDFAIVTRHWLNWHLLNDQAGKNYFTGRNCYLCQNPDWEIATKRIN